MKILDKIVHDLKKVQSNLNFKIFCLHRNLIWFERDHEWMF
jgi:hypothetical protein